MCTQLHVLLGQPTSLSTKASISPLLGTDGIASVVLDFFLPLSKWSLSLNYCTSTHLSSGVRIRADFQTNSSDSQGELQTQCAVKKLETGPEVCAFVVKHLPSMREVLSLISP